MSRTIRVDPEVRAVLEGLRRQIERERQCKATLNDAARVLVLGDPIVEHHVTIHHEGHGRYTATCSAPLCEWTAGPDNGPMVYGEASEHDTDKVVRRQTVDVRLPGL